VPQTVSVKSHKNRPGPEFKILEESIEDNKGNEHKGLCEVFEVNPVHCRPSRLSNYVAIWLNLLIFMSMVIAIEKGYQMLLTVLTVYSLPSVLMLNLLHNTEDIFMLLYYLKNSCDEIRLAIKYYANKLLVTCIRAIISYAVENGTPENIEITSIDDIGSDKSMYM
jgi:hypothetical protein